MTLWIEAIESIWPWAEWREVKEDLGCFCLEGICREEGCYASQPKASNLETILYEFSPVPTARSGQESLAQGSPCR
jgi:hypothetical protein